MRVLLFFLWLVGMFVGVIMASEVIFTVSFVFFFVWAASLLAGGYGPPFP